MAGGYCQFVLVMGEVRIPIDYAARYGYVDTWGSWGMWKVTQVRQSVNEGLGPGTRMHVAASSHTKRHRVDHTGVWQEHMKHHNLLSLRLM